VIGDSCIHCRNAWTFSLKTTHIGCQHHSDLSKTCTASDGKLHRIPFDARALTTNTVATAKLSAVSLEIRAAIDRCATAVPGRPQ
jgi:hypothetical protein